MSLDVQVRCIATARVLMPKSVVRLSAGRLKFGFTDQARISDDHIETKLGATVKDATMAVFLSRRMSVFIAVNGGHFRAQPMTASIQDFCSAQGLRSVTALDKASDCA